MWLLQLYCHGCICDLVYCAVKEAIFCLKEVVMKESSLTEAEVMRKRVSDELQRTREELKAEREKWYQEKDNLKQVCWLMYMTEVFTKNKINAQLKMLFRGYYMWSNWLHLVHVCDSYYIVCTNIVLQDIDSRDHHIQQLEVECEEVKQEKNQLSLASSDMEREVNRHKKVSKRTCNYTVCMCTLLVSELGVIQH